MRSQNRDPFTLKTALPLRNYLASSESKGMKLYGKQWDVNC